MRTLEVFADVCCPFTHVGLRRVSAARDARGAQLLLRVRAWPLELVNGRPLDPGHVAVEVDDLRGQVASDLFASFDPQRFPASSIPAFGLTAAAYDRDPELGERTALALRTEMFEHGRDVADPAVLAALAGDLGLVVPPTAEAEARARADWEEGRARGVVGSPFFFVDEGEGWFCPMLDISRQPDGHFRIEPDHGALDHLLARVLG